MKTQKYNAKKTVVDGITFVSRKEAKFYQNLKLEKALGIVEDFTLQPKFLLLASFKKNGRTHRAITYKADFHVTYADGKQKIIDCKGFKTEVYKIKKKLFEYKYPELEIVEV